MRSSIVFVLIAAASAALTGCAATSKKFYADPQSIKDTQLCRTYLDAAQKGEYQFATDVGKEAGSRGLTLEQCQQKVAAENAVIVGTALVATAVGVGIACRDGCSGGGGGYQPAYAPTDYDCAGGGGNGPLYVQGPFRINPYNDPYKLDADNDGIACELGEGGFGT
jgi:hypothetical protein